jgi:hypothetical protein
MDEMGWHVNHSPIMKHDSKIFYIYIYIYIYNQLLLGHGLHVKKMGTTLSIKKSRVIHFLEVRMQ